MSMSVASFRNYSAYSAQKQTNKNQRANNVAFSSNPIETVLLRTGIEEAKPLVNVVMMSLKGISQKEGLPGVLAVYDLAQKCKNPQYAFFGKAEELLKKYALVQEDGKIHSSIRNIVNAASEGEGLEHRLVNPITGK